MSTAAVTRADFQQLADIRVKEARALLHAGLWDGAYYLAGYAVEIALKACIIKAVMTTDAFLERNYSANCWTHDLAKLLELAGLKRAWDAAITADPNLSIAWGIAKDWKEDKRYHRVAEAEATALCDAVSDTTHGVLSWIKTQW